MRWLNFGMGKFLLIVLLLIIGSAAFVYFFGNQSFNENQIGIEINGPKEISSGELVDYKIVFRNDTNAALTDVKISFFYPPDVIATRDGNILDSTNEAIDIGELAVGENGNRTVSAYVIGDKGNIKTARAILTYRPTTVSSRFEKEATFATTITTLAVPLVLVAPPSVLNGQTVSYLIDYRNQSNQDFFDLKIKVKYPEGFKPNSFTPPPSEGTNTWNIGSLRQGSGSRITIQGTLNGAERETKMASVTLQKKIATPNGDVYVAFEKAEASSVISTPLLSVSIKVNDSTTYTAHLADTLRYEITFINNSHVNITSLTLVVALEGSMYDFSTVRSDAFFDSRNNSIIWNSSVLPELALLRPNQKGTAVFSVNLKNSFSGGVGASNS